MGAVLVAAAMVLAGCTTDDGVDQVSTTTNPSATEQPGNPWDLPLEQRPPLFDPCEEIPIEAVEAGVGSGVEPDPELRIHQPGELMSCAWMNNEVIFAVLSTWKSRSSYLSDSSFIASDAEVENRVGLRLIGHADMGAHACQQLFFTSQGTVFISIDMISGLSSFKGVNFVDPCEALEESLQGVMSYVPGGDFR